MPDSTDNLLQTFAQQVAVRGTICTVYDDFFEETPTYITETGKCAEPYWSNSFSVDPKYAGWFTREVSWNEFLTEVLPRLERNNVLVGVNCSKPFDDSQLFNPNEVRLALERKISAGVSETNEQLMHFAQEVAAQSALYTVRDDSDDRRTLSSFRERLTFKHIEVIDPLGPPELYTQSGRLVAPYWSSISKIGSEFEDFSPVEISWSAFQSEVLPRLEGNNLYVGINCADCLSRPVSDTLGVIPFNLMVAVTLQLQLFEVHGGGK